MGEGFGVLRDLRGLTHRRGLRALRDVWALRGIRVLMVLGAMKEFEGL